MVVEKKKVIYSEPQKIVNYDKHKTLKGCVGWLGGCIFVLFIILILLIKSPSIDISYYTLLVLTAIICGFFAYLWYTDYITRVQFKIYENGIVPSYKPLSFAIKKREYMVPYDRMLGMNLKSYTNSDIWVCEFIIDKHNRNRIEFTGRLTTEKDLYDFLSLTKVRYLLKDYKIKERKSIFKKFL